MNKLTLTSKNFLIPWIILLVGLIVLVFLPFYAPIYTAILLSTIFMYIVLTSSWAMFSGPTGYLSLATAAFFGFGIYSAASLGKYMPLFVVVLIGGLASAGMALLIGGLTLRLKGVYFAIFTFGLLELIKNLLLWFEIKFTGTRGRFVVVVDYNTVYFYMLAILVLTLLTAYLIRKSKFGLALQSIGEQEEAAEHIGINVTRVKISAFAISAFFIGASGAIMATRWTYIDPYELFFYAGSDGYFWRTGTAIWSRFRRYHFRLSGRNLNHQIPLLLHAAFRCYLGRFGVIPAQWPGRLDPTMAHESNGRRKCPFLKAKGSRSILAVWLQFRMWTFISIKAKS
jgi:branched-chain amino acid transport system permease protein